MYPEDLLISSMSIICLWSCFQIRKLHEYVSSNINIDNTDRNVITLEYSGTSKQAWQMMETIGARAIHLSIFGISKLMQDNVHSTRDILSMIYNS